MERLSEDLRRRAPREKTSLSGTLRLRTAEPVTVLDLSSTGCLVRCAARPEPGAILDLEMDLGGAPLRAKVRVADTSVDGSAPESSEQHFLTGLEFLSLPADEGARLLRYLEDVRRRRCASGP